MTNFDELQSDEEFRLTAPEGENHDEDSLGELSTNEAIFIDDSRIYTIRNKQTSNRSQVKYYT